MTAPFLTRPPPPPFYCTIYPAPQGWAGDSAAESPQGRGGSGFEWGGGLTRSPPHPLQPKPISSCCFSWKPPTGPAGCREEGSGVQTSDQEQGGQGAGHQAPSPPVALGPDAEATREPCVHTQTPLQRVLICFLSWAPPPPPRPQFPPL